MLHRQSTRALRQLSWGAVALLGSTAVAAAATFLAPTAANAYPRNVNERQYNQQRRIWNGVYDGRISPREYNNLQRRSWAIEQQQRRYWRNDGRIDAYEREQLNRRLDRLSEDIYRDRRDW
jgi:hypothetical protein